MPTPHKHCKIIQAWAEGVQIQIQYPDGTWVDLTIPNPNWNITSNYRIKPEPITIHGFINLPLLEYCKNPYAVFHKEKSDANHQPCTLIIHPDE